MPLTMVITRDVEDRYRGFLGSAMLELAPGVYAQPRMSAGVRTRIWTVVEEWHTRLRRGSIVMCWAGSAAAGGLGLLTLGSRPRMSYRTKASCWCAALCPPASVPEKRRKAGLVE